MTAVLKKLTLGLLVILIISLFAGCNYENEKKDVITFAQASNPITLDPGFADDIESGKVICNIYEGLVKFKNDSVDIEPSLSKSWEISSDAREYTFYLRDDVKFHDGTEFNAQAVKTNIDRYINGNASPDMTYASEVYGSVESVDILDKYTVKIRLKDVSVSFINGLAMVPTATIVSPKALSDSNNNVNENPVGTGPYKFEKWENGDEVHLVRNEEYWGTRAECTKAVFKAIPDMNERVKALKDGKVDIIDNLDASAMNDLSDCKDNINTLDEEGMNVYYFAYNTQKAPFDNVQIRKAVSQAVNVPEMTNNIYQTYAFAANSLLPTFIDGYSLSIKQPEYNPDSARDTLKANNITEINMITNTKNGLLPAQALKQYLREIGVELNIDSYDWADYSEKIRQGDYDVCFYGWAGDNGDPDNFLRILSNSDYSINVSRYNNKIYNDMIEQGIRTTDREQRKEIYTQLELIQAEDSALLPLWHHDNLCAYSNKLKNLSYHMTGIVRLADISKSK